MVSKNVEAEKRAVIEVAPPLASGRQDAHDDAVDVEQRQDQQAPVGRRQAQGTGDHLDHGGEVGVVEHDALGSAGCAARVDEERGRGRIGSGRGALIGDCVGRQRAHFDAGQIIEVETVAFVDQHPCSGVLDLEGHLPSGEGGVHRRECRAEPPCREHRDDELGPVGEERRDHLAGPDAVAGERRRRRLYAFEELVVAERQAVVVDARAITIGGGRGDRAARRSGRWSWASRWRTCCEPKDPVRRRLRAETTTFRDSFVRRRQGAAQSLRN